MEVVEVPIRLIDAPKVLPRWAIEGPALQELADSIAHHGLLQPVTVVRAGERFRLVAGNRRLHACRERLGWDTIPAVVLEGPVEEGALTAVENLQRQNLDPVEEAVLFATVMDDRGITQEEMAELIGKSRSYVAKRLMLLELDEETLQSIVDGEITWTHALELKRLDDLDQRGYYLHLARDHGVNVRVLRSWVDEALAQPAPEREPSESVELTDLPKPPAIEPLRCTLCGATERETILTFIPVCYRDKAELERILEE